MRTLLLLLAAILPLTCAAETIALGQQGADAAATALPKRGESRHSVLDHYGLADEEHPAVGNPPITRWDYREFSVYFEYDHVVDSVHHLPVRRQ